MNSVETRDVLAVLYIYHVLSKCIHIHVYGFNTGKHSQDEALRPSKDFERFTACHLFCKLFLRSYVSNKADSPFR